MFVFVQEKKRTEAALGELRRGYETEVCELQCKIQRMQMVKASKSVLTESADKPTQNDLYVP